MTTDTDNAQTQAKAQLDSIIAMVQRLEHARECAGSISVCRLSTTDCYKLLDGTDGDAVKEYHDEDAALQAIQESPLSVLVRSGWYNPSEPGVQRSDRYGEPKHSPPVEYEILLHQPTFEDRHEGPAVRIRGDLDNGGQPNSARLEYQSWGTPWEQYLSFNDSPNLNPALLTYAQQFYFGD